MSPSMSPSTQRTMNALATNPGSSINQLTTTTGLSRSSVAKALASLERDGLARRDRGTSSGRTKTPDLWSPVSANDPTTDTQPTDSPPAHILGKTPPLTETSNSPHEDSTGPTEGKPPVSTNPEPPSADAAAPSNEPSADASQVLPPSGTPKLTKGQLRQMVFDYVAANPDQAFGPSQLAASLGRSSGAISNALDKLAHDNMLTLVQEKPRRFQLAATSPENPEEDPSV